MKEEQAALIKKASDSIEAAKMLKAQSFHDFSVSRSYYAMFYLAEAFLLSKELSFSKHSAVIAAFGLHFVKTDLVPQKFHRYLLDSQEDRLSGDYDFRSRITEADAGKQILRAEEFLTFTRQFEGL